LDFVVRFERLFLFEDLFPPVDPADDVSVVVADCPDSVVNISDFCTACCCPCPVDAVPVVAPAGADDPAKRFNKFLTGFEKIPKNEASFSVFFVMGGACPLLTSPPLDL